MSHYTHLDTPCLSSMNSFYHSPFIAGMAMPESLIVLAWSLEAMPLFSSPCQILQDKIGTPFHFWHRSKIFVTAQYILPYNIALSPLTTAMYTSLTTCYCAPPPCLFLPDFPVCGPQTPKLSHDNHDLYYDMI